MKKILYNKGDIVRYKSKKEFTFIVKQEKNNSLGLYKIFAPNQRVEIEDKDWSNLEYIGNVNDNPELLFMEV